MQRRSALADRLPALPGRRLAVTALLALVFAGSAHGAIDASAPPQTPERRAAAELLRLIGIDEGVAPMARRMRETTLEQLRAMEVAADRRALAEPYLDRIGAVIEQALSWENLREDFVSAYADRFTEQELRRLIDFFGSETGRKYLDSVSTLNRLAATIVRQNALEAAPRIREITEEMRQALPPEAETGT